LFGEESLRTAIRNFVAHYHAERNHQGLVNRLINPVWSKYSCGGLVVFEQAPESTMALNPATLRVLFSAPIWEE
jgi:hypothetical protein